MQQSIQVLHPLAVLQPINCRPQMPAEPRRPRRRRHMSWQTAGGRRSESSFLTDAAVGAGIASRLSPHTTACPRMVPDTLHRKLCCVYAFIPLARCVPLAPGTSAMHILVLHYITGQTAGHAVRPAMPRVGCTDLPPLPCQSTGQKPCRAPSRRSLQHSERNSHVF